MKRRLLLLLAAVLLLRGWAVEVMAGEMLAQQLQAVVAVAQVHEHCGDEAAPADRGCFTCDACTLNALPATFTQAAQPLPHAREAATAFAFRSADPSRVSKPPIA